MTMVSSGPISLGGTATTGGLNQSINVELGYSGTAQISLNDSAVRTLLGKASGAISLNDAYGKSNSFAFTISANQTNADLRTLAINAGWDASKNVQATIGSGIYISSNSTSTAALTVTGQFPGGVKLTNNGYIAGMGGAGGKGGGTNSATTQAGQTGFGGGGALSVSVAVTIDNTNGTIGGGGGGGGGGAWSYQGFPSKGNIQASAGGGGGGGGRSSAAANSSGGAAGGGRYFNPSNPAQAGQAGTSTAAGNGGTGGNSLGATCQGGVGGNGGGWGSAGSTGGQTSSGNGDGSTSPTYAGGSGGYAVSGNSNITWTNTGTRLGSIS